MAIDGPRYYYVGPWQWSTDEMGVGSWQAPEHTVGLIDLRPLDSVDHYGFFATDTPLSSSDYVAFGDSAGTHLGGITLTTEQRNRWASMLGITDTITSTSLLDVLWDTLTIHADPEGGQRAKPLVPTHRGNLSLHLGGHSLIKARAMPRDITWVPHWDKLQYLLQLDYRNIRAQKNSRTRPGRSQGPANTHQKWLGAMAYKYRMDFDRVSELLTPSDLPRERPEIPTTTLSDDFNRSSRPLDGDEATWGGELQGWTWTGQGNITEKQNVAFPGEGHGTYAAALSSDDHYVETTDSVVGYNYSGRTVRHHPTDTTFYFSRHYGSKDWNYIAKVIDGSVTQITTVTHAMVSGDTLRLQVDGSTLSIYVNGSSIGSSYTDTSITGNLHCGMWDESASGSNCEQDNFVAMDLHLTSPLDRETPALTFGNNF